MLDEPRSERGDAHGLATRLRGLSRRWRMVLGALAIVPIVAVGVPDTLTIPAETPREADGMEPAVFSHWQHNTSQCYACHPSIFPQERVGFTHAAMADGAYCGACHDGVTAWKVKGGGKDCETCHIPAEKSEEIDEDDLW